MDVVSRRDLLRTTILAGPTLALMACANGQGQAITQQVLDDLSLVANGLLPLLPLLGGVKGVPADAVAQATTAANAIIQMAQQISAGMSVAAALPLIQQIGSNAGTLITVLTPFLGLLPPPAGTIIMALQVLIPVIELAVGIAVPKTTALSRMTPDQARLALRAVAAR